MTGKLAIFTPQIGTASETFIRRHIDDLRPGEVAVVARSSAPPFGGFWDVRCPVMYLDRHASRLPARIARALGAPGASVQRAAIARFLRLQNVTVALGEYLDQFLEFVPLLDRMKVPYIVQGHGVDVSAALRVQGMPERYLAYRSAKAILTRCEFHRQRLIALGLDADRVHVNPGGIEMPDKVPERSPEARRRFLALGRMVPKKGPIYLLEAFRIAAARNPGLSLDYIGDGPLFGAAMQFLDACKLRGRVRLHGAAPDETKSTLFRECGVFVQHSITDAETGDEEGLPAAIQEAMAHGMAIVSTRHSGIPEAVEDGVSGLLVDEGDCAGMAEAMLRFASAYAYCVEIGAAARIRAGSFTWGAEKSRLQGHLRAAA